MFSFLAPRISLGLLQWTPPELSHTLAGIHLYCYSEYLLIIAYRLPAENRSSPTDLALKIDHHPPTCSETFQLLTCFLFPPSTPIYTYTAPWYLGNTTPYPLLCRYSPLDSTIVLLLLLFPIFSSFIHCLFHWCSVHIIICHCLFSYIFDLVSESSTPQLLTSDSSCLISCCSRSQSRCSVLERYINVRHNRLWAPASRRFTNITFHYNVQFNSNFPQTQ